MANPRILLVDDQRQVSRMLRSSLEFSGGDYTVVEVPSGEEAMLELARGPVDLLVTDLRLPGMSGLELLEKVRQLNPKARAIIVTGQPTEEAQSRAESLGVVAFLHKPIGTSIFLEAVEHALRLRGEGGSPVEVPDDQKAPIVDRLTALQRELGSVAALLVDDRGGVVAESGQVVGLDLGKTLSALSSAFSAGLKVSNLLGSLLPANFQYFDGDTHDLYLTNVGAFYALIVAYRAKGEAGQMGAVVHYSRRAADDLLDLLSHFGRADEPVEVEDHVQPFVEDELPELGPDLTDPGLEAVVREIDKDEAERFWDEVSSSPKEAEDLDAEGLTYDQARKLGLLDDEPSA